MIVWRILAVLVLLFVTPAPVQAKKPSDELLGLRLGMPMHETARRLEKLGRLGEGQAPNGRKQHWKLNDPRFANLVVRFDGENRVQWVTVFARPGGRVVHFSDIGDLKLARQAGKYIYLWEIEPRGDRRGYQVTARSLDPKVLSSVSLSGPAVAKRRVERATPSATVR